MNLSIVCTAESRLNEAESVAQRSGLELVEQAAPESEYVLLFSEGDVRLRNSRGAHGDVWVDFCGGRAGHRRRYGGGKNQLIAKAVGIKGTIRPRVYDLTAGLGGDSFVLASLGCEVVMLERNPIVYALLADGLRRAEQVARTLEPALLPVLERMQLSPENAIEWLGQTDQTLPVIYLDPMFPERKKTASVKKEMQAFHQLVGSDPDEAQLLNAALAVVENRVVVKRPRIAPCIGDREPSYKLEGKSSRYDIYTRRKLA